MAGAEAVINGTKTSERDLHITMTGWVSSKPDEAIAWFDKIDTLNDKRLSKNDMARGNRRAMDRRRALEETVPTIPGASTGARNSQSPRAPQMPKRGAVASTTSRRLLVRSPALALSLIHI